MSTKFHSFVLVLIIATISLFGIVQLSLADEKEPVDHVNPYMGNISHLLVPTYPTIHLPYSMMRVFPVRADYTTDRMKGLPLIITRHRQIPSFYLTPYQGEEKTITTDLQLSYDKEKIVPYRYQVWFDELDIEADFAPSHQSAVYNLSFEKKKPVYLIINNNQGDLKAEGTVIKGFQYLANNTKVFIYAETTVSAQKAGTYVDGEIKWGKQSAANLILSYPEGTKQIGFRYGISFISEEQARKNLQHEISGFDVDAVAQTGRDIWNKELGKICIEGGTENEKAIFYTSLYRCFERPVCLSEDGRYFSAYDGKVHNDEGRPFYTDDWIWDTYRATHPLRILIDAQIENDIINSYMLMAQQKGTNWMPTFPGITGDSHSMNSNHGVAMVMDAYAKGLRGFDLEKAYLACKEAIEGKSLIPWTEVPAGELDAFYKEKGYFPALRPGEKETVANVHAWEKRQPIAVTLGTSYDHWCLSLIARELGRTDEANLFLKRSYNYRNLFNPQTGFFHPKDKDGNFIENIDYRYSGGLGARDYYDENNAYIYRWDVQHNIGDLISLIGGNEAFVEALEQMFNEPLGKSKWEFYATLPDHTGNVGQFSMANEPCLHIPYLYNYAAQPWKTQKRIRTLMKQWFRNDLMGVPGDEDGGGMSAFVTFSAIGFYPVTPGSPTYNIGSPLFNKATIDLGNGKHFEIEAVNCSDDNKYIQSATLNGKNWNKVWFHHNDIKDGGKLRLIMSDKPNTDWGTEEAPPSAEKL